MPRVTVYHVTKPRRLPLIEEQGLRTRAEMSQLLGPPSPEDLAAPGRFAHGRRVSGYLSRDHAVTHVPELGQGLVSFTVDPKKVTAVPASSRGKEARDYWAAARPLSDWLAEEPPDDLEVHQHVPVRAKHVRLHPAVLTAEDLGEYAPIVGAIADEDRLSAKALMHLAIVASAGDFDAPAFLSAVALAYRDEPDPDSLLRELVQSDPDKVASAALAEYGSLAADAAQRLRETLDEIRSWSDDQGVPHGQGLLVRSAAVLEGLARAAA